MREAYIMCGFRTPVGKAKKGGLRSVRSDDLASLVIQRILKEFPQLEPSWIDDLLVGNAVPEAEQGMQMGRLISLLALSEEVPGMLINRYCGSGLEAIHLATARIRAGTADCIIAGGTESMSMVPMMGYTPAINPTLVQAHPDYFINMGLTAEEVATAHGISREDSDNFSLSSHQKAIQAQKTHGFEGEMIPVEVEEETWTQEKGRQLHSFKVDKDEGPRSDTHLESLSQLKPVFKKGGQVTAGNSSQTSDGAAFLLVVSEKFVKRLGPKPLGRMVSYAVAGVPPRIMGIGPVNAIPKALKQANLRLPDIEQIELNEAFACQALAVIKALDISPELVNVNGGAVALGHPLGCTGAKLTVQLLHEMTRRKQRYGMVTACVGGGQGVAGIFERF
ncbi:MAG: acetyl-CoA C-acyltransferase [Cytophagales bacterium]|nr:acetyl-CoA C-acyltransferase [Cytophagales bacterium]